MTGNLPSIIFNGFIRDSVENKINKDIRRYKINR